MEMFSPDTLEQKFIDIFLVELRRQGVAQPSDFEKQFREHLVIVETGTEFYDVIVEGTTEDKKGIEPNKVHRCVPSCASVQETSISHCKGKMRRNSDDGLEDDDTGAKKKFNRDTRWTFELDLSGQHLGNNIIVALCETLLKLNPYSEASVIRWHVLLNDNELTDQCIRHLGFILFFCPSLELLVMTENHFTKEGIAELRRAIGKTQHACEVHYDRNEIRTRPATSVTGSYFQSQEHSRRNANDVSLSPRNNCEASSAHQPISTAENLSPISAEHEMSYECCHLPFPMVSSHRSPRTAAAISPTPSPGPATYAIGNTEALRRRREELFGKAMQTSSDIMGSEDTNATKSTINNASDPQATFSPLQISSSLTSQRFKDTTQVSHVSGETQDVSPLRWGIEEIPEARWVSASSSESDSMSPLSSGTPPPVHRKSCSIDPRQDKSVEGAGCSKRHYHQHGNRNSPSLHEPFGNEDELEFTMNLNPIIGSVLDLSCTVSKETNTLSESHTHGEAKSVWDAIEAYVKAAQQPYASEEIDQETSVKLPASFSSWNAHSTITVLNLSDNHLKRLRILPAALLQLDISNNDLTHLSGLSSCTMLTVLNARRNRINQITGLERNICLKHVFLGRNRIKAVEGLAHLLVLETLDLSHNRLRSHTAIRALSLCSSLRHLLLKGNPVVDNTTHGKGSYCILRNLCPSLLMIDNRKLSQSRLAEKVERQENYMRQPMLIDSTHQPRISFDVENGVRSVIVPCNGDDKAAQYGDCSVQMPHQLTSTASRASAYRASKDEGASQNPVNLLYLLTHGVNPRKGYSDTAHVASKVRHTAQRAAALREAEQRKKLLEQRHKKNFLREDMMKLLSGKYKKYLETSIVEHITQHQLQQLHIGKMNNLSDTFTTQTGRTVDASKRSASRIQSSDAIRGSSIVESLHCTVPSTYSSNRCMDVLKQYEPSRFCPSRGPLQGMEATGSNRKRTASRQVVLLSPEVDDTIPNTVSNNKNSERDSFICEDQCKNSDLSPLLSQKPLSYAQLYASERTLHHGDTFPMGTEVGKAWGGRSFICEAPVADESMLVSSSEIPCAEEQAVVECSFPLGTSGRQDSLLKRERLSLQRMNKEVHRISAPVSVRRSSSSRSRGALRDPTSENRSRRSDAAPRDFQSPNKQYEVLRKLTAESHRIQHAVIAKDSPARHARATMLTPSLDKDAPLQNRILTWEKQVEEDIKTVQAALKVIVSLLETQWNNLADIHKGNQLKSLRYVQERQRCVEIIQKSGMLSDTQIPKDVVEHYGFNKAELERVFTDRQRSKWESKASRDRMSVLQQVRMLGDAKTCLRYLVILIDSDDESLLQDYVNQVKLTFKTS